MGSEEVGIGRWEGWGRVDVGLEGAMEGTDVSEEEMEGMSGRRRRNWGQEGRWRGWQSQKGVVGLKGGNGGGRRRDGEGRRVGRVQTRSWKGQWGLLWAQKGPQKGYPKHPQRCPPPWLLTGAR